MNIALPNSKFFKSFNLLGSAVGRSLENIVNRKLIDLRAQLKELNEDSIDELERLNQINNGDLHIEKIEDFIELHHQYVTMLKVLSKVIQLAKEDIQDTDEFYNELTLVSNSVVELIETNTKIVTLLNAIHNEEVNHFMSVNNAETLGQIWNKPEDDEWDAFYKASKTA